MAYKPPRPLHVQWNRLLNSLIMISAVFSERIELLYLFGALNSFTFILTIRYGPTRWILWPIEKPVSVWLDVSDAYARSYAVTRATERFEVLLRLLAVSVAIALYGCCPIATWLMAVGMGIFMLISTFFGFCLSALGFIWLQYLKEYCRVR